MDEILRQYKSYLVFEQNLSNHSVDAYSRDVKRFLDYMRKTGVSELGQITPRHVHRLIRLLTEMGLSAGSLARNISSIRGFYRFLNSEKITENDPTQNLERPKLARKLPAVLTYDEVKSICATTNTDSVLGLRNRAMLETIYA